MTLLFRLILAWLACSASFALLLVFGGEDRRDEGCEEMCESESEVRQ